MEIFKSSKTTGFIPSNSMRKRDYAKLALTEGFGIKVELVGLGGLGVTCSPRDPRFAG